MAIDEVGMKEVDAQVDLLVKQMDTHGIQKAVLSPYNPFTGNDIYLKATEVYPDRLFFAVTLIPRPIRESRSLLRSYIERGAKALVMDDQLYHHLDPATHGLVQSAVEENIPVYFRSTEIGVENLGLVETFSTMYPEGQFVILNMGGLFSFPRAITLAHRNNVWFETSHTLVRLVESPMRHYLDALVQDVGAQRLVLGSGHHTEYSDLQASLNMVRVNVEQNRAITLENAKTILGI